MQKQLVIWFCSIFLLPGLAMATTMGSISQFAGNVSIINKQHKTTPAKTGALLFPNHTLQTGENSYSTIFLRTGSLLVLFKNTRIRFSKASKSNPHRLIILDQGTIWIKHSTQKYQGVVRTPTSTSWASSAILLTRYEKKSDKSIISAISGEADVVINKKKFKLKQNQTISSKLKKVTELKSKIILSAPLKKYYLPKSGKLSLSIDASLIGISQKIIDKGPHQAIILSDHPYSVLAKPLISFNQKETAFKFAISSAGRKNLYIIAPRTKEFPGAAGSFHIEIRPSGIAKTMKIKTSRGTIHLKLVPK